MVLILLSSLFFSPVPFRHVSHVGFDPKTKSFSVSGGGWMCVDAFKVQGLTPRPLVFSQIGTEYTNGMEGDFRKGRNHRGKEIDFRKL